MAIITIAVVALIVWYKLATKKTPERIAYEQKIETVSLEGKVQEFPMGANDEA